jgi:hypothetical protein
MARAEHGLTLAYDILTFPYDPLTEISRLSLMRISQHGTGYASLRHVIFEFQINHCYNTRTESVAQQRKKKGNVHITRERKKNRSEVGLYKDIVETISRLIRCARPAHNLLLM